MIFYSFIHCPYHYQYNHFKLFYSNLITWFSILLYSFIAEEPERPTLMLELFKGDLILRLQTESGTGDSMVTFNSTYNVRFFLFVYFFVKVFCLIIKTICWGGIYMIYVVVKITYKKEGSCEKFWFLAEIIFSGSKITDSIQFCLFSDF